MRKEAILAELVQIRSALTIAESEPGANSALKAGALLDMLTKRIEGEMASPPSLPRVRLLDMVTKRIEGEEDPRQALDDLDAQGRADIAAHPEAGGDITGPADMEPFWQYHDPSL